MHKNNKIRHHKDKTKEYWCVLIAKDDDKAQIRHFTTAAHCILNNGIRHQGKEAILKCETSYPALNRYFSRQPLNFRTRELGCGFFCGKHFLIMWELPIKFPVSNYAICVYYFITQTSIFSPLSLISRRKLYRNLTARKHTHANMQQNACTYTKSREREKESL